MIIEFNEHFRLPAAEIYSYFHTPADWARLYGLAGDPKNLGDGWYAIGLERFSFPLVAKNTEQRADEMVRWVFRGFWRGRGEVRFCRNLRWFHGGGLCGNCGSVVVLSVAHYRTFVLGEDLPSHLGDRVAPAPQA